MPGVMRSQPGNPFAYCFYPHILYFVMLHAKPDHY